MKNVNRKINKVLIALAAVVVIIVICVLIYSQFVTRYIRENIPAEIGGDALRYILVMSFILMFIIILLLAVVSGISYLAEKKRREELMKLAYVDELTGGYTFIKFRNEVQRIAQKSDSRFAIVSIDIDGFKLINNLYGYEEGNNLIKMVYNKICDNLNIIYQDEIVAHQEADKFVVLMHYYDSSELEKRIRNICKELSDEYMALKSYLLRPVVGIYDVTDSSEDVRRMVDYATIARKAIKGGGHEVQLSYYDEKIKTKLIKDRKIEGEMGEALENKAFHVFYQPKYSTIDGSIVGAEALVRWKRPDGSYMYPGDFIELFESNGFIATLDKYMFNEVCMAQRRWLDAGIEPVPVSVNLSRVHLYDLSFIDEYEKMIYDNNVPSNLMQIEITESAIFENRTELKNIIDRLHACGITILMDDFGTGYSTMMMLKDFNIDVMKLDKTFVEDIGNERGEVVINAIIKLAQSLDMEVTAEGVETKEQYVFLKNAACDNIQGYYFSKPIPEYEYEELLKKR